jgi:chemotaxis protein methyltransferase CheR
MALSQPDFEYVRQVVRKRSAIVLESEKLYLAETRLQTLARKEGYPTVDALVAQMRREPQNQLQDKVVEAMTTNETSFFRDQTPFDVLREKILPELLQKRATERRLNIWCGAASSGQEPYTFCMMLRDHFPQLSSWELRFLASDLSLEVLAKAKAGRYSQLEINRGMPAKLLVKYFMRAGVDWQLKDEIRNMVEFRQINLIEPWPPIGVQDIVFLRNVLIYFDVDTKRAILANVRRVLKPDGFLFLGAAETTLNVDDHFERLEFDRSGCYRLKKR